MVSKKKLDFGFNGFQVPFIPKAPRSVRRRGSCKKFDDDQICAFELLAAVAGKLLQESESSTSSNAAEGKYELSDCRDGIKCEQVEEDKAVKSECLDQGSCVESAYIPEPAVREQNLKHDLDKPYYAENNSILEHTSTVIGSDSDMTLENCKEVNVADGNFPAKVEDFDNKITQKHLDDDSKQIDDLTVTNTCSVKGPIEKHVNNNALFNSESSVQLSLYRDLVPRASFVKQRNSVKLGVRDDDDNSFGCYRYSTKLRTFRTTSRIGYRRIRKMLTSRRWKVAPKLKEYERSYTNGGVESFYISRKSGRARKRCQPEVPSKRRKLSDHGFAFAYYQEASSESISNSLEKGQTSYCHSFDVYYTLIDKLGAAKEFKIIDRLLLQMKEEGVVFKESLFIVIMKHYGRAGLPGQATRILLDMWNTFSCEPTFKSYNQVLDILLAENCPKVAPNVFYEMLGKGISPSVFTFSRVIQALCIVNEVDSACSLLRDMTKHGCVPNSVIYQILIRALSKSDRVNDALKLLEEMFLMGCIPDINTFNDIIHGLCRADRIHEAAKLVDRMLLRGFTPDAITYGFLMHALCRTGRVDEARVLLNKAPEQNNIIFNMLINGYVTNGRFDEAKFILNENMLIKGYQPDVYTYNILIRGLCKKGSLSSAHEVVKEMSSKSCQPNVITYTTLIDGFSKAGRLQEAYDLVTEMSVKGLSLNIVGFNSLISALCKQGMIQQALEIFGDMSSKGCKPDIFTFNALISGFCKVDKMGEALGMYRDMFLEGVIANTVTYNTLIHAFLRKGKTQEALKLVNDMLFRGCPLDEITYNGLVKALCNDGAIERAVGLFEEMLTKGIKPNHVTCNILVNGFCRIGKVQNALEFLRDLVHRGLAPDIVTYNSLINGFCNNGRIREAHSLFEKLEVEGVCADAFTYNTLISSYCKMHMLDDAYTLLTRGIAVGFIPNNVTWYILVRNFVRKSYESLTS